MLINQFNNMVSRIPQIVDFTQNRLLPWLNHVAGNYVHIDQDSVVKWLQSHIGGIEQHAQGLGPDADAPKRQRHQRHEQPDPAAALAVLFPFGLETLVLRHQRVVPRRFIDTYTRITSNMDEVLGEFLRGQLMVMLIMGLVYGVGLMLVGLDSGFAIGMIAGILVFIPYLGAFTGLLLATVAALLQFGTWNGLIMVWVVFAIGQFLESFIVTPKIVGDRIGLSPFWVIFSLMAFGQLMASSACSPACRLPP